MGRDAAQQLVTNRMAIAVVHQTEALHIDGDDRDLVLAIVVIVVVIVATTLGEGAIDVLDEQRAIGQASQTVVQGVVNELLLGALADVDIADRASHARDLARVVAARHAAGQDPAILAVGQAYPVLHHESRALALEVLDHALAVGRPLIGVDEVEEGIRRGREAAWREPENFAETIRVIGRVCRQIPVPQAVVCAPHGKCVALLAGLQASRRVLQFGHAPLQGGRHDVEVA